MILEPSKLRSMGIINAHNELSLIGSDIKDWSNYEIEALKLPEMKFAITSYGRFYEIARESKQFVRSVLDGCDRESVDIKSQSLFIYKDINIIFGGKGSGKTILLKDYLYPQFVKKALNTILHEGKNYHDEYVKMLETFSNKTMVADTDKDRIIEKLSSVLTYKESKPSNALEQEKKYCDNKSSNKLALLIKKTEAVYSKASPDSYKSIIKNYRDASMHIHYVKKINNDTRDDKSAHRSALNQELETLNKELREKMLDSSCDIFSIHQTDKFLKNLKAIVEKKTGKVGKPNNYGFSKLVRERRVLIDNATTVIKDLSDIEKMECNRLGSLPDKGEILFRVLIKSLKHTTRAAKQEGFVRSNDNKKILKKIVELNVSTFDKINEYFSPEEKARDINELFEQIVVKECSVTKVDGARYTPSDGEESILSITGIIQNTDYDCYLFDEIERGLGNKYVAEYLIPQLKNLRDLDKYVILSTHNANIAVSTLPSQTIYCDYRTDKLRDYYYQGDMFSDELKGIDSGELINWEDNAISHLEGGESMFGIRRNVWY